MRYKRALTNAETPEQNLNKIQYIIEVCLLHSSRIINKYL